MQLLGKRNRLFRGITLAGALASVAAIYGAVSANPFPGQQDTSSTSSATATTVQGNASTPAMSVAQGASSGAPVAQATSAPQPTPTTVTTKLSRTSRGS
jgi:hypothetical protein